MTKNKTGKVILFRKAYFYMKRGAKELEKNDLIAAIAKYREAYERAPKDAEIAIALAEILSQMQRFEESNRILYRILADQEDAPRSATLALPATILACRITIARRTVWKIILSWSLTVNLPRTRKIFWI
jgi:tetratricopeptide (TPR) repeat protein